MSDSGQFLLPPDVRALVEADRHASEPPVAIRERMARDLERKLGLGALALGTTIAATAAASVAAAAPASSAVVGTKVAVSAARLLAWKVAAGAGLAMAVGGGLWPAMSGYRSHAESARVGSVAAVVTTLPSPSVREPAAQAAEPASAVTEVAPREARPRPASQPAAVGDRLGEERAVLDGARRALSHRDGASALQAIRKHDRLFPRGQLVQERESMRVQALVLAGEHGAARSAGERFRRNYPRSVLLGVIDRTLEALP